MKKVFSVCLIIALLVSGLAALAEGKLTVSQETAHVTEGYTIYGYAYARVENSGDVPITINNGSFEVYDANGETIASADYLGRYAVNLEPGQYGYVKGSASIDDAESADVAADYALTVLSDENIYEKDVRFPVECEYRTDVETEYDTVDFMYVTVSNDTEETVFDAEVVLVLVDDAGNILYMDTESLYDTGIQPGGSIVVRKEIPEEFKAEYEAKGYVPSKVDAIAYKEVWIDD